MTFAADHIKNRTPAPEGPVRYRVFDDHEEFASAALGWIPIVRKLDRGAFAGSLLQIDLTEVRIVHVRIDNLLEIEGIAPPDFLSFGIPVGERSLGHWCGHAVSGGRFVNSFDESGSFEAVVRPDFESFVVSVRKDWLFERCVSLEVSPEDVGSSTRVSEYSRSSLRTLLEVLKTASDSALTDPDVNHQEVLLDLLRHELPRLLLELQSDGSPVSSLPTGLRGRILLRARDWIEAFPVEEYTVANLCRGIGAGERTVRRAFLERFGVTPLDYLKAQRLNRVYRELLESDPVHGRVSDVANRSGFWHLGQLAADYREIFDELPSETLARAHP